MNLLRVENNPKALAFEEIMQGKIRILTAKLLTRHKGGDSVADWLTHAAEAEAEAGAKEAAASVFVTALLCNEDTMAFLLENQPAYLAGVLEAMLEQLRHLDLGKLATEETEALSADSKQQ